MSAILQKAVDTVNRYYIKHCWLILSLRFLILSFFIASREQHSTSSHLSSPSTTSSATSSSMFCNRWSQYIHPFCSTFSSPSKSCSKISWCSSRCKHDIIKLLTTCFYPQEILETAFSVAAVAETILNICLDFVVSVFGGIAAFFSSLYQVIAWSMIINLHFRHGASNVDSKS